MAYQALYRKWRPQTFDMMVGQSAVTHTLKNTLAITKRKSYLLDPQDLVDRKKTSAAKVVCKGH